MAVVKPAYSLFGDWLSRLIVKRDGRLLFKR
jgi:hypothetical protein